MGDGYHWAVAAAAAEACPAAPCLHDGIIVYCMLRRCSLMYAGSRCLRGLDK